MSVVGEGRRKVVEERERGLATRSLYEVVGRLLMMDMEVFKPVVTMLVAEGRNEKRERERFCWQQKWGEEIGFFVDFKPKALHTWTMKIKSIYRLWKRDTLSLLMLNLSLRFDLKAPQPLVQSSNNEMSVLCRKMVVGLATLGRCHRFWGLNQLERLTLACSQVSRDRLHVRFVHFSEKTSRQMPRESDHLTNLVVEEVEQWFFCQLHFSLSIYDLSLIAPLFGLKLSLLFNFTPDKLQFKSQISAFFFPDWSLVLNLFNQVLN